MPLLPFSFFSLLHRGIAPEMTYPQGLLSPRSSNTSTTSSTPSPKETTPQVVDFVTASPPTSPSLTTDHIILIIGVIIASVITACLVTYTICLHLRRRRSRRQRRHQGRKERWGGIREWRRGHHRGIGTEDGGRRMEEGGSSTVVGSEATRTSGGSGTDSRVSKESGGSNSSSGYGSGSGSSYGPGTYGSDYTYTYASTYAPGSRTTYTYASGSGTGSGSSSGTYFTNTKAPQSTYYLTGHGKEGDDKPSLFLEYLATIPVIAPFARCVTRRKTERRQRDRLAGGEKNMAGRQQNRNHQPKSDKKGKKKDSHDHDKDKRGHRRAPTWTTTTITCPSQCSLSLPPADSTLPPTAARPDGRGRKRYRRGSTGSLSSATSRPFSGAGGVGGTPLIYPNGVWGGERRSWDDESVTPRCETTITADKTKTSQLSWRWWGQGRGEGREGGGRCGVPAGGDGCAPRRRETGRGGLRREWMEYASRRSRERAGWEGGEGWRVRQGGGNLTGGQQKKKRGGETERR